MTRPSRSTVARWHERLRAFRFTYAAGGHANDADSLYARLPFTQGEAGLRALFEQLELPVQRIPHGAPRLEDGHAYTAAEWRALPLPIRAYPDYVLPRDVSLFGCPVLLSVQADSVHVFAAGALGNTWAVTERDFENAAELERQFALRGIAAMTP